MWCVGFIHHGAFTKENGQKAMDRKQENIEVRVLVAGRESVNFQLSKD